MRAPDWLFAQPIAHRGLHDKASGVIENTLTACADAVSYGFGIEVDLQLSADGEAMVHHDYELGRLTEGSGYLRTMTVAQLKAVKFHATSDAMMTLGDLCNLVGGRVPLVLEIKSAFDGDRKLVTRVAEVLAAYRAQAAVMSFDPDQVMAMKQIIPQIPRGIVAEDHYDDPHWHRLSIEQRDGMRFLRHAFRTRPHFVAYSVNDLPSPAPWIARNIFRCPLLTWTVRTEAQRERAGRHADQMIFEGFRPDYLRFD